MSIEYELKKLNYLKNYREVCKEVYIFVKNIDNNARVFVFGSVLTGNTTASSDIDILVLESNKNLKDEINIKVLKYIDAPVELHIVDNNGLNWYKRFLDNIEEIT
ncbi:nucleotidyltransferase domain-containing protein [Ferroplasma acidarmanus]|jgi:hypothetical protein|uniref:DNA polymerase beta subunit n=1 Tax=Ferroplasma acidarmanus Fer1 TaxID=333146 RepID=S0ASB7_FERAC|nr:nucleotidyltransferase domain-containing protein [Ferroplasma acidarmanus]AGO61871.1 DNA polymerase beta subunit [Ferroplasma acidarmanus Fer1]